MQTPTTGNPAAAAQARRIILDPQLCAENDTLRQLAWLAYRSNRGKPAIQHRLPKLPPRPVPQ